MIEIRPINWQQTIPIRHRVLWPNKPKEFCHINGDNAALHYGAFIQGDLVCVASIYIADNKARLRKFATEAAYQSKGIGTAMLRHIIDSLSQTKIEVFWCDARESAMSFYQAFGMVRSSERFYKADVPYFRLSLNLS